MSENIGHEKRWLILGIMSLSLVIVMLNNVTLNVALPEMSKDLQADNSDLQWIVDSLCSDLWRYAISYGRTGRSFWKKKSLTIGIDTVGDCFCHSGILC